MVSWRAARCACLESDRARLQCCYRTWAHSAPEVRLSGTPWRSGPALQTRDPLRRKSRKVGRRMGGCRGTEAETAYPVQRRKKTMS